MILNLSFNLSRIPCGKEAAPDAIDLMLTIDLGLMDGFFAKVSTTMEGD